MSLCDWVGGWTQRVIEKVMVLYWDVRWECRMRFRAASVTLGFASPCIIILSNESTKQMQQLLKFIWNENQLMSLFYSYIAGSLHVSGPQAHLQESSHSCSHNHWFSICTALVACSVCSDANRAVQILNQWLCEQLYELSWRWACGPETCRYPAIYE